jgi:outer membrane protein assembly factor BamA
MGLRFRENKAYPRFVLQERKVNEADGVLGLLPNELEPGKVLLTGRLALDIHNLFASGKRFRFEWQQMRPETQSLDMAYEHPVFLGSPLDIQASLQMLREANDFLNIRFEGSLRYLLGSSARMSLLTGNHRGTVPGISLNPDLPRQPVDLRYTFYGLQGDIDTRDDPFHPYRGSLLEGSLRLGNRKVLDQGILGSEGKDLNSIKLEWDFRAETYFSLRPRLILKSSLQGGQVLNRELFANELLRVGGLQRLRGFNENFFFSSGFGLLSLEPRFYLDPSSYLFLFFDQSVLQLPQQESTFVEWPFGAGAGLSFTTEAGIFNLAFALGRSAAQPFDFEYAKVHIGYVSRF